MQRLLRKWKFSVKWSSNARKWRRAALRQHGGSSTRTRHRDGCRDMARPLLAAVDHAVGRGFFYPAAIKGGIMIDMGWLGQISFTWEFFAAVMSIVFIDLVLAGDNAVVIAMACKNLPGKPRLGGIGPGAGA